MDIVVCKVPQCVAARHSISTSTFSASTNGVSSTTLPTVAANTNRVSSNTPPTVAVSSDRVSSPTSPTDKDTKPGEDKLPDQKSGSEQVSEYPFEGVSAIYIKSINILYLITRQIFLMFSDKQTYLQM